jgi:UDP-N-acetylglucosamine pyrophosphorylase
MQTYPHLAIVIMAAGKGTRMKDTGRAKVMYELDGKPMIHYVLRLAVELKAARILPIVGYQRETVEGYVKEHFPGARCVTQAEQLGTGHAVMQTESALEGFSGNVLVLSGDVPLLEHETIDRLIRHHRDSKAVATILTAELDDPSGYGRIIRNADHSVKKIVEHRDASPEELLVQEINSGIYVFDKEKLFDGLQHIKAHNVQNEYYLTDVFEYFWKHHWIVSALKAPHPDEIRGVNTVEQLMEALEVVRGPRRKT